MTCEPQDNVRADTPRWAAAQECPSDRAPLDRAGDADRTLLRVREAAEILRVSEKTIRRLISSGNLTAVRIGRLVRIPVRAINRMIECESYCDDEKINGELKSRAR
jgi:excisionase family DNA binding protein